MDEITLKERIQQEIKKLIQQKEILKTDDERFLNILHEYYQFVIDVDNICTKRNRY